MKKKLFTLFAGLFLMISSIKAIELEYLKGDEASACEAMLCLASPVKPPECSAAIARYFSIKFKKPWKTIQARKDFLKLCPTSSSDDIEMSKYVNDILPNLDGECSIDLLNSRAEKVILRVIEVCEGSGSDRTCRKVNIYGYRTNPQPTQACALLSQSSYTNYNLKYTCNSTFYEESDWLNGYTKQKVSKQEFDTLANNERTTESIKIGFNKQEIVYYKKIPIKKDCWINEGK
ncbi:hypothetical protein DMB95_09280 [Campylobacter sp. MIT 12-8780]|uniref:TrbM/KikA/MpfK family conjugal transfer protein n=1 Tax=unclassified Campylobacter TaxID=2593542 RepID=UPI0010FA252A|nr:MULTISPECIES: TrbM/KikA/MpfK family conjugal transfer protein [unclassified Campylobacter]NDJ28061.1 hypothetical protein [Campylobacter sp. MIT 19-121]TKX28285.1 hypothetical protein CQA38_08550 [Campylobacter sp. MIT 12-5580]TQR39973.1 hypothetical protein DMB95_09280 [Campylobacter sp. MIT 12-8780]